METQQRLCKTAYNQLFLCLSLSVSLCRSLFLSLSLCLSRSVSLSQKTVTNPKRLGGWNRNQFYSKDPKRPERPLTTQKDKWKHSNDSVRLLTTNCSSVSLSLSLSSLSLSLSLSVALSFSLSLSVSLALYLSPKRLSLTQKDWVVGTEISSIQKTQKDPKDL